jgi:predicted peptidase
MKKFDTEALKELNAQTLKLDRRKINLIGICFAALAVLLIGFLVMNKVSNRMIVEAPRTETPMGEMTKLFEKKTATRGKLQFTYYWMRPEGPRAGERYPVVVVLHDGDGNAFAAQNLATQENRKHYRAYIVAPVMGQESIWSAPLGQGGGKEQRLAEAVSIVLDQIKQNPIDADRVYIVGCGDGGTGAYGATRLYPGLFAAAMPVNSTVVWHAEDAPSMTNVPMLITQAPSDATMPTHALADAVKKEGGEVKLNELPNTGCSDSSIYSDDNWKWLFSHRKNQ